MMKLTQREYDRNVEKILSRMRAEATPFRDDSEEAVRKRVTRSEGDKFYFFKTYLPHYFTCESAPFHHELIDLLDVIGTPVAVAAPRGHAKSTIVTLAYPLHQIMFSKRNFIIIISDTEYQASSFVRFIQLEIEENERLKTDFEDLKGRIGEWSENSFLTRNGVKILARGRGQKIRGLRNRQHRPDLVVGDDIENDKSIRNPRIVKQTLDWILEAVYPSMEGAGNEASLFIIGTLLSRKSVLAQLLENEEWVSKKYQAVGQDGIPLWAGRYSKKDLDKTKAILGSMRFNKEYQNDPRDEEGLFREEWIRYYHPSEIKEKPLRIFGFADLSSESGASNDYKSFITIGIDPDGIVYLLDAYIRHCSMMTFAKTIFNRVQEFKHIVFAAEENALGEFMHIVFDVVAKQMGMIQRPRGIKHTGTSKETRIAKLSAPIERGMIRFQKGQGDQDLLIEQLIYYPSSTVHDDGPDALEGAVDIAEKFNQKIAYRSIQKRRFAEVEGTY